MLSSAPVNSVHFEVTRGFIPDDGNASGTSNLKNPERDGDPF